MGGAGWRIKVHIPLSQVNADVSGGMLRAGCSEGGCLDTANGHQGLQGLEKCSILHIAGEW